MVKLIGIKELQTKTSSIRKQVTQGVHFIVLYRSKPVFEIKPISNPKSFVADLQSTNLYTDNFLNRMKEAEEDLEQGRTTSYSTEEFLKSL